MNAAEYGQWYYLIYLVPGGAALLTLAVAFMGSDQSDSGDGSDAGDAGSGHTDGGHTDGGHGDGGNVDGDGSSDRAGVRGGLRAPIHQTHIVKAHGHGGSRVMQFFGFGSIPTPFAWGSLLLGWSVFGFWATQALREQTHAFVGPAMAVAAGGALIMARVAAFGIGKLKPEEKSTAVSTVDLVGLTGEAAYPIDSERGRIMVYDQYDVMHDSQARVSAGQPVIGRGKKALIVDYDPKRDVLIVEESV